MGRRMGSEGSQGEVFSIQNSILFLEMSNMMIVPFKQSQLAADEQHGLSQICDFSVLKQLAKLEKLNMKMLLNSTLWTLLQIAAIISA